MSLENAERRVYEDFTKVSARIDKMPDGPRKNRAMALLLVLQELCFGEEQWFIMSSSFSTLSGSLLEMLSEILDILDLLHTASIEFTVLRESGSQIGLEIIIRCLLAEQKDPRVNEKPEIFKKNTDNGRIPLL